MLFYQMVVCVGLMPGSCILCCMDYFSVLLCPGCGLMFFVGRFSCCPVCGDWLLRGLLVLT